MVLQQNLSPRCDDIQNYATPMEILNVPSSMESREFGFAEQTMEHMTHLMEERHNVIVSHQSGLVRRGLGEVGNHCGHWVASLPIKAFVTR